MYRKRTLKCLRWFVTVLEEEIEEEGVLTKEFQTKRNTCKRSMKIAS